MNRSAFAVVVLFWVGLLAPTVAFANNVKMAVLEFAAGPGTKSDWAPLGKGFQEMILVDMSKANAVDVVERRAVREQRIALGWTLPGSTDDRRSLGKAAGATHVLSGGFVVKGQALALTTELLDVATGKVLLSNKVEGEAEAFFELEKEVVQASIGALDVSLSARERAETGRLHTADFLAFQDFSRGLDDFDAERYESSLSSLRRAAERDTQFSLASITLDQYAELITQIRDKADAVEIVKAEQERLEKLAKAGGEVEVVRRLLELARGEGKENLRTRMTALHTLAIAYGNEARGQQLMNMRRIEDRFAMERASDELWKQYYREAKPLWPAIPVVPDEGLFGGVPKAESFDKDFDRAVKILWEKGADYPANRRKYLGDSLRYPRDSGRRMHLSLQDEVELHHRFVNQLAKEIPVEDWWYKHENDDLLKIYPQVLRFDDATRILKRRAETNDNQYALRGFASQIEDLKEWVEARKSAADPRRMDEWMMIAQEGGWSRLPVINQGKEHFAGKGPLDEEGRKLLTRMRDWPSNPKKRFVRFGEVPAWCHQHCYWVWTGPRTDPRVASSARFYKEADREPDHQPLLFLDSAPRADIDAGFTVSWARPDDFQPSDWEGKDELEADFLFGLVDLDVKLFRDEVTDENLLKRPMRGYQVRVTRNSIAIDEVVETERESYDRKILSTEQVRSVKLKRALRDGARIGVSVRGNQVTVLVDKKTVLTAKIKEAPRGFAGLAAKGLGYVEVGDIVISGTD